MTTTKSVDTRAYWITSGATIVASTQHLVIGISDMACNEVSSHDIYLK